MQLKCKKLRVKLLHIIKLVLSSQKLLDHTVSYKTTKMIRQYVSHWFRQYVSHWFWGLFLAYSISREKVCLHVITTFNSNNSLWSSASVSFSLWAAFRKGFFISTPSSLCGCWMRMRPTGRFLAILKLTDFALIMADDISGWVSYLFFNTQPIWVV